MTLRFSLLTFISILFGVSAHSQDEDVHMIRKIHDQALAHG